MNKMKWGLQEEIDHLVTYLLTWLENTASLCREMAKMIGFQLQLGLWHQSVLFLLDPK